VSGEHGSHPRDAISVFVGSRALFTAKDTENPIELNQYAGFFPGLANRGI
jgi:hypothetical protein